MGLARDHDDALLLSWVDVLGDNTPRHAAPVEADELSVAVLGGGGVRDPLTGSGVEEGPETWH